MHVVTNYWFGTIVPISTIVKQDDLAASILPPWVFPPMSYYGIAI